MSLAHRFSRATRPLVYASMAGSFLSMSAITVLGQQPQHQNPPATLTPAATTPILLPAPARVEEKRQVQQIPSVAVPNQFQLVQHEPSLMDRVRGTFRSASKTAPADPGMNYPKAPRTAPPPAPGVAGQPTAPAAQPALLQPPVAANPIRDLVPPAPSGIVPPEPVLIPGQSTRSGVAAASMIPPEPVSNASTPEVRNVSELKVFMQPQAPVAVVPPAPVGGSTPAVLPKLDFNAPVTEPLKTPAPGEPSDTQTAEVTPPPDVPGIPSSMNGTATASKDPFADLFPGDQPKTAEKPAAAPKVEELGSPYTGLTLESDPAPKKSAEILPPPPLGTSDMELPKLEANPLNANTVVTTPDVPKLPAVNEPVKTATRTSEMELTLPGETPKLTPAPKTEINIQPAPSSLKPTPQAEQKSKFERIAARQGQTGLKGFCPVVLRDQRELVDSREEFHLIYNGHEYQFSSKEAMQKFGEEPLKYAPASGCSDVIHLALTGEHLEGSLDHAVWYKGRLYLFSGVETMETFVAAPSSHASAE